jgi:hypothetical protein
MRNARRPGSVAIPMKGVFKLPGTKSPLHSRAASYWMRLCPSGDEAGWGGRQHISNTCAHIQTHTYISIFISISISTSHVYIYFLYTHISLMPISQKQRTALISACVINKVRSEGEYLAHMLIHIPQHHNIHIKIRITVVIDVHLVRSKEECLYGRSVTLLRAVSYIMRDRTCMLTCIY